jgi:hypothetical protein
MVLFATLALVRVVNRSTGLAATTRDSFLVSALAIWTVYATGSPWFLAVAALAFLLDAILKNPQKKQLVFSIVCFAAMVIYIVDHDSGWLSFAVPASLAQWLAILATLMFGLNLPLLKKIHSQGDVGGKRLDMDRVKAGMMIALLATLQGLNNIADVVLMVATIGGLCLGIAFRRSFRSSGKGLRHN